MRGLGLALASCCLAVVLGGCSKSFDAWFANPCDEPVKIEIYFRSLDAIEGATPARSFSINAMSLRFVEDAFSGGKNVVALEFGQDPFSVVPETLVNETVLLPASSCS